MPIPLAKVVLALAGIYLACGVVFCGLVGVRGVERLDSSAADASLGARILLAPGLILLWPWLTRRLWRGSGQRPPENNAHRIAERRT